MNEEQHLVLHGLGIKKYSQPEAIASLIAVPVERVRKLLEDAVSRGSVSEVGGKLALSPTGRVALQSNHGRFFATLRSNDAFRGAYLEFERANNDLKTLITDWQTLKIAGKVVANDHSNASHDEQVMKRLAKLHHRAEGILKSMGKELPRMVVYQRKLEEALDKAESGQTQWVSDAKIESYHTVWFELHEDLLCMMGEQRSE